MSGQSEGLAGSRGPIHRAQLGVDRVVNRLRASGVLPAHDRRAHQAAGTERENLLETGRAQLQQLATQLDAQLGATLDGRTALDYGCGFGRVAVPLAERCELVYGLDVAEEVLAEAASNAEHAGVSNVDWRDAGRLAELEGLYDLVISYYVFQHIPPREGERILEQVVRGLRPGGVGVLQFVLRPPLGEVVGPHPLWRAYGYWHSYSLNRIGAILARAGGVHRWQVNWQGKEGQPDAAVVLVFEKQLKPSKWVEGAPGGD